MITSIPISEVPMRRGRPSPLEAVVKLVLALPLGRSLKIDALDLEDAKRIQHRLERMLRYRGMKARIRTHQDAVYVWREVGK
jgi:hypothetical protein